MFQDEASFGRISEPANCWSPPKCRPSVPCQRIREYRPVYCAVSPADGEVFIDVLTKCNTLDMSVFLQKLSLKYHDELILLVVDQASYHRSKDLLIPDNIRLFFLPPRTPEMNPVEILWREIRKRGFKNKYFDSIKDVIVTLHEVVRSFSHEDVQSLTFWGWIREAASICVA